MRTPDELAALTMCARCKSLPGFRCVVVGTHRPTETHAPRLRVVFETQAQQYEEDVHYLTPDSPRHRPESCDWCKAGR